MTHLLKIIQQVYSSTHYLITIPSCNPLCQRQTESDQSWPPPLPLGSEVLLWGTNLTAMTMTHMYITQMSALCNHTSQVFFIFSQLSLHLLML